jgi:hypothetical protein
VFLDLVVDALGFEELVEVVLHVRPRDFDVLEVRFELVECGADLDEFVVRVGSTDACGTAHRFFEEG